MDKLLANAIRFLSIDMVENAVSGHIGMPLGMADVATVLFKNFLKFNPLNPSWPDRDRFILSNGHGSALLYSLLYLTGYEDATLEELKNFRQLGAKTAGHPEYGLLEGVEVSTGPLGQGIATSIGMALCERMLNAKFGDELVNHKTYVTIGDGCLAEGIGQEAITFAGHLGLKNLIVLFDDNEVTIDGPTSLSTSDDHIARFRASNWNAIAIDGHDFDAINTALLNAQTSNKPTFIACKTKIGYGSSNHEGKSSSHGTLNDAEYELVRLKLNWPHMPFDIPDDILKCWRDIGRKNAIEYEQWQVRLDTSSQKDEFNNYIKTAVSDNFYVKLHDLKRQLKYDEATRKSSGRLVSLLADHVPNIIGGSADLTLSNNTKVDKLKPITRADHSGNYIHYGEREHVMAAVMNGIYLHKGFIPYGGTFLVFSDYCRPSMRLSALMGIPVIYIMTHDSIGLGEDGPTHQPVEHLVSFRAMPNMLVMRPSDCIETIECWEIALRQKSTPSILALTRQDVPQIRFDQSTENRSSYGAYILRQAEDAKVVIYASGSELNIALQVANDLEINGINIRVISVPCIELFDQQSLEYRKTIISNDTLNVVIEAAAKLGWEGFLGLDGLFFGMNTFGKSGNIDDLYQHFGIHKDNIINKIKQHLKNK